MRALLRFTMSAAVTLGALATTTFSGHAQQQFPTKPVRLLVGIAVGSCEFAGA